MLRTLSYLLVLALGSVTPAWGTPAPLDFNPCALLEGVPGPKHPIRKERAFKKAFRAYNRAKDQPEQYHRAHQLFRKRLTKILDASKKIFHPAKGSVKKTSAQRFLKRYVLNRNPVLRIGNWGFEPQPTIRAALIHSACMAGDKAHALAYARDAAHPDDHIFRSFAALLLFTDHREEDAVDWLPTEPPRGFLEAWVVAALHPLPSQRKAALQQARRQASTRSQRRAIAALEGPGDSP